jgi:hypothetical protein
MSSQPSATEAMGDVARIAGVREANRRAFIRLLDSAIRRAHIDSRRPNVRSVSAARLAKDFFDPIVRTSKALRDQLERLRPELQTVAAAGSVAASHFFTEALRKILPDADALNPIGDLTDSLDLGLVIEAAERASKSARSWLSKPGRKKGTGRPAFDMFVISLLVASQATGGRLTIYRTPYGNKRWAGSLPKALQELRSLLPISNFFPAGTLGHSLHSVYQRWRLEAGKSRRNKE